MENFAKRLAISEEINGTAEKGKALLKRVDDNAKSIKDAYEILCESAEKDVPISLAGEWLLDNYYIVMETVNAIKENFDLDAYKKLPGINGVSRIEHATNAFVEFENSDLNEEKIVAFFNFYQMQKVLNQSEIYELGLMMKIALIDQIAFVSTRIFKNQLQKFKVESLIERLVKNKEDFSRLRFSKYQHVKINNEVASYVEHLIYKLKRMGSKSAPYLEILENEINKSGSSSNELVKKKHYEMALSKVTISNAITSLKNVERMNWERIFERINPIEKILSENEVYTKLSKETKEIYRNEVKIISEKCKVSEIYVANELIEMNDELGKFLVGDKRKDFLRKIDFKFAKKEELKNSLHKYKLLIYLAIIYVPTFVFSFLISKHAWPIIMIPLSEVFVCMANKTVNRFIKPKPILRVDEIDEDINTFVIVPTLLKSRERVLRLMNDIETYYLRNKINGIYFCLLGDASEENEEHASHDEEVIKSGLECVKFLNEKYCVDIFNFAYRKRVFNKSQGTFLGFERKRGMINEFNNFLLRGEKGTFIVNTIKNIPKIKYVITLDADTNMMFDTAKKLIGAMEHPLNKPVIENGIVVKGYGLIQPKLGLSIESAKSSFSKIYAGTGGIDIYSTAESNVYQDLFGEGIFTGKGIYNLQVFDEVLKNEIPENKVLSHDLLEGSYLRVGLATDIELIDGFPAKFNSYLFRMQRWIRGDWQIVEWLGNKKLSALSKYKIFDNLRRSLIEPSILALFFLGFFYLPIFLIFYPIFLGIKKRFFRTFEDFKEKFIKCTIDFVMLPYKAIISLKAIFVTLYRMLISKKKLLEWVTAADAEKMTSSSLKAYVEEMILAPMLGVILALTTLIYNDLNLTQVVLLFVIWYASPFVAWYISRPKDKKKRISKLENDVLQGIAKRTWDFFDENISAQNNFLIPDNYDESRKLKFANYTSPTNIGLSLISVISAFEMGFINFEFAFSKIDNVIQKIEKLEKWNGHLYNWYNLKTLEPLEPKFVSTVDSGNLVGYLYVTIGFLSKMCNVESFKNVTREKIFDLKSKVQNIIFESNFQPLFDYEKNLFSIGFDISKNKQIDSYYDLLASEARLASFVSIAKGDISYKHWFNLGRVCTEFKKKKGLVSWSGTMFEYLMPNIIMKNFDNSLLKNSCDFAIFSQIEYGKSLNIPWGISESAFALKDLKYNYQYKAVGVPWLGLKRGINEDIVVSPYSCIMALEDNFDDVYENIKKLKSWGAFDKYGFYESIDFTPSRVNSKKKHEIVKTYMAHHQALILASICNFLCNEKLKKYFEDNAEIRKAKILLEEKDNSKASFVNDKKDEIKKLSYKEFDENENAVIHNSSKNVNIQTNDNYTLLVGSTGDCYKKSGNIFISKFNFNERNGERIFVKDLAKNDFCEATSNCNFSFSSYNSIFRKTFNDMDLITELAISAEDNVDLRSLEIRNNSDKALNLSVVGYEEFVLSEPNSDLVHPAYNSLFQSVFDFDGNLIVEKRFRDGQKIFASFFASTSSEIDSHSFEYETDKLLFVGRNNHMDNPIALSNDTIFSNTIKDNVTPCIALKCGLNLKARSSEKINFFTAVSYSLDELKAMILKYKNAKSEERLLELAKSRALIENRFYDFKPSKLFFYNKLMADIFYGSSTRKNYLSQINSSNLSQNNLWKFGISGDFPMILICIKSINDIYMIREIIDAVRYFYLKNIFVDLIILICELDKEKYIFENIMRYVYSKNLSFMLGTNGGFHIVDAKEITADEFNLLHEVSDVILNAKYDYFKE